MFGLAMVGTILLVLIVLILLAIEIAFWVVTLVGLSAITAFLWATGLLEDALALVAVGGIACTMAWAIYRLTKWDLDHLGTQSAESKIGLAWHLFFRLNPGVLQRNSGIPKDDVPPLDPEERLLWANRLGGYAQDTERATTERSHL